MNAAYETYYSGGVSTRSFTTSERPSASRQNSASSSSSNLSRAWKKVKEHHDGMNNAFASAYGVGRRLSQEQLASQRNSVDEHEQAPLVEKKEGLGKKIKTLVKEHHRSVNAAYRTYYGA